MGILQVDGECVPGYTIEIVQFPQGSTAGRAKCFVDGREDNIRFTWNSETDQLDAWSLGLGAFKMDVLSEDDHVYGLDIIFPGMEDFVVSFVLDDGDSHYGHYEPRCEFVDITAVEF